MPKRGRWSLVIAVLSGGAIGGCNFFGRPSPGGQVPEPINTMLPKTVRLSPFTGTKTFSEAGGVRGIDVSLQAIDSYGDPTKAFGNFRFELYEFRPNNQDPRGDQVGVWEEDLLKPERNLLHWDNIAWAYKFKLKWRRSLPVGQKYVLVVVFTSPFTERKFAQREFVSGD